MHRARQNVEAGLSVGDFLPTFVVLCLLRQGVFTRGQTRLHVLSPGTSVACSRLTGVSADGQCLQVTLVDVLETRVGSPSRPLSSCQYSVQKSPWGPLYLYIEVVLYTGDMAQSVQTPTA